MCQIGIYLCLQCLEYRAPNNQTVLFFTPEEKWQNHLCKTPFQLSIETSDLFLNVHVFIVYFFSVRLLLVLRGHSLFSSPPQWPMTSDFERFSIPDFIHYIYFSYLNSWERASIFPFECSVLNKGTTGTIFITSLVWRGPWLGIEPGTARTRSQHYTTRLSRRRFYCLFT